MSGLFNRKAPHPVVMESKKWIQKLRAMEPNEMIKSAQTIKKVVYVKGNGRPYFELVLYEKDTTYVEVTTEGMMYIEHKGNYLLFSLDAPKTKDVLKKLKEVAEVLEGGT